MISSITHPNWSLKISFGPSKCLHSWPYTGPKSPYLYAKASSSLIFNTNEFIYDITYFQKPLSNNTHLLLENSLFYYCSGNDPSPIFAFGTKFPLYIYVDSFIFMKEPFPIAAEWLYNKLKELKFTLKEKKISDFSFSAQLIELFAV